MKINKRGQDVFGMSFGTIFSIFIIIFIVAVAFFAIRHFVGLSKCTNVGLFYDELREEVRDAWISSSGRYEADKSFNVPKKGLFGTGIEYICFGKLSDNPVDTSPGGDEEKRDKLIVDYRFDPNGNYNVFAYPPDKGCDSGLSAIILKCGNADCITTQNTFFCKPVLDDGTVTIRMTKQSQDYQITIS
jgi:hypothetical protein